MLLVLLLAQLYLALFAAAQRPVTYGPQGSHDYCLHAIVATRSVDVRRCNINDKSYYWSPYTDEADDQGRLYLRAYETDLCLTAPADPFNGLELTLTNCPQPATTLKEMCQRCSGSLGNGKIWKSYDWRFRLDGTIYCMDNSGGRLVDGNKVHTWECDSNNRNQLWMPTDWNVIG